MSAASASAAGGAADARGDGAVVVSAPGKVLLAGGYLVLDPAYPGVVVSTSSRFYSVVQAVDGKGKAREAAGDDGAQNASTPDITVHSPQFVGAEWSYRLRLRDGSGAGDAAAVDLEQTTTTFKAPNAGKNPFVGLALLYCHRLALELLGAAAFRERTARPIRITVVGDNDFYSQRSPSAAASDAGASSSAPAPAPAPTSAQLRALRPFAPTNVPIRDVHKTGLGSSAAMTTSLVGALLVHLGVVGRSSGARAALTRRELALVHNTAQLAHCAAQGKVGSGFDVSAAVWGSQLYRRFRPQVLQPLLDDGAAVLVEGEAQPDAAASPKRKLAETLSPHYEEWQPPSGPSQGGSATAAEGLAALSLMRSQMEASASGDASSAADADIPQPAPLHLPPRLSMVLADVDTGSNTPSLVSKVLAWKAAKPDWAKQLYSVLDTSNQALADGLIALTLASIKDPKQYDASLDRAAAVKSKDWDALLRESPSETLKMLVELRNTLRSIRAGMRELGERAGVPVEPREMGDLIRQSCDSAPGILGGAVPGAGGYDALYLLYIAPRSSAAGADADADPRAAVERFWTTWKGLSVGPLLSTAGSQLPAQPSASAMPSTLHPDLPDAALQLSSGSGSSGLRLQTVEEVQGLRDVLRE